MTTDSSQVHNCEVFSGRQSIILSLTVIHNSFPTTQFDGDNVTSVSYDHEQQHYSPQQYTDHQSALHPENLFNL